MDNVEEKWQQIVVEIGEGIYRLVNTPDTVGTDDETGYILMFFNARHHEGKSTLVSTATERAQIKKLLKTALREVDNPRIRIIPPEKYAN